MANETPLSSSPGPQTRDENMKFHANIDNQTGANLSKTSENLEHGKWNTSPPPTIANNTTDFFSAKGTEGSAVGTQGNVVYQAYDGTQFKFTWDIPYDGSNSGGMSCDDGGTGKCSEYTTTAVPSSFPTGGDEVTVSYTISQ